MTDVASLGVWPLGAFAWCARLVASEMQQSIENVKVEAEARVVASCKISLDKVSGDALPCRHAWWHGHHSRRCE